MNKDVNNQNSVLLKEIIKRLKPLKPDKIILFGSYAYGKPNKNSDIDLYIVTNDDFMPQNWREKSCIYRKFVDRLDDLQTTIPIDLIVHTKKMYDKFIEMDSMFSRKIINNGKVLL